MNVEFIKYRLLPLSLTALIILIDQITKLMILYKLSYRQPVEIFGDFLRFTLIQNPAIAFSIGRSIQPDILRLTLLILPLTVLIIITGYYFITNELSLFQRWLISLLLGGGIGNYIDRLFRPNGVVDFIDFKFFGILGWERYPTFNVADSSVVIAGILLMISYSLSNKKHTKEKS